jgi:PAS domain S-box-containing protein
LSHLHYFYQLADLTDDCVQEIGFDGRVVSVNPRGLFLLQADSDAGIVGQPWSNLWPPETRPALGAALDRAKQGGTTRLTAASTTFKGQTRWWRVSILPLMDSRGEIRATLAISHDITEAHDTEAALQALTGDLRDQLSRANAQLTLMREQSRALKQKVAKGAELRARLGRANAALQSELKRSEKAQALAESVAYQAQKGEAIGQLVAGVAHDFNNMLHICMTSLDALAMSQPHLDEKQTKLLHHALQAAEHAGHVAGRLVTFSRSHADVHEAMRLDRVVATLIPLIQHSLGTGMTVRLHESPEPLCIVANAHSVEQSVMNLCLNARDACEGRGEIDVVFGIMTIDDAHASSQKSAGDYIYVEVRDNGCGMSSETLSSIFEPFFTTKPEGAGSGLGLAQVHGTARKAGGFVEASSAEGKGSAFRLVFPKVDVAHCA